LTELEKVLLLNNKAKEGYMPNWCNNNVTITSPDQDKLKAISKAAEEGKMFEFMHPMPAELARSGKEVWTFRLVWLGQSKLVNQMGYQ
jgi:hypothetical protein